MPFNVSFQPAQGLVGQAGFQTGLGQYNQFLQNLQLQQAGLQQQGAIAQMQTAANVYGQQLGVANQQYMQTQDIANQQVMQARNIASQQYMQQQGLLNSRVEQMNQLAAQQYSQFSSQAFQAGQQANQLAAQQASQVYGTQANLFSQQVAGTMQSALSAQNYMQSLGLGDQQFNYNSALANQQAGLQIATNQAGLQSQLDFLPQFSEAQYQAQQAQFSSRFQALQDAANQGLIDPSSPEYSYAQQNLLSQQLGLRQGMPTLSDASKAFNAQSFVDTSPGGTGMRYLQQPDGTFQLDPGYTAQINQQRYQAAIAQRTYATGQQSIIATQKQISDLAKILQAEGGLSPQQAVQQATNTVMANLQQMMGVAPAPALAM